MSCQCGSDRIAEINGKTSDCCSVSIGDFEHDGYVPDDMGVGGGDYIEFMWCLDCGQIQGDWPAPTTELEETDEDEEEDDE